MTCDSCGTHWFGFNEQDVLDAGWTFHTGQGGSTFVMCNDCEGYYSLVWAVRATPAVSD
jgi:hypothetical protein